MDTILLLVPLRVEGLGTVDVLLRGAGVLLEVLCCIVVGTTGVVVCARWRDVAFVTCVIRRHWGSLLWRKQMSVNSSQALTECNFLQFTDTQK